jgi:tetratricopeptide (TPR) repeat protein
MPSSWDIRVWALPEGARVLVEAADPETARRLVDGDGTEPMMPHVRIGGEYGRAALLEAEERYDDALPLYRSAATWYGGRASVYHEARALVGAGRCGLALGRTAEATADLLAAAEIFDRLGATVLRRELDLVLGAGSERAHRRSG